MNRGEKIATAIMFSVFAYLAGSLTPANSYDTAAYTAAYGLTPSTQIFEKGYMWLSYYSAQHGLLYPQFRMIVSVIAFFIFYLGIIRLSTHPSLFSFLYALTIFPTNATQVRNLIMLSFVIFGYSLLTRKKIFNLVLAGCIIFIGTQFQSTGYLYLLGILLFFIPFKKLFEFTKNIQLIIFILFFCITVIFGSTIINTLIPKLLAVSGRGSSYADVLVTYANGGLSWFTLSEIVAYCLVFYIATRIISYNDILLEPRSNANSLYILMLVGIIGLPLTFTSASFDRLIINSIIPALIIFSNYFSSLKYEKKIGFGIAMVPLSLLIMFGAGFFNKSFGYIGYYLIEMLKL
jgi:hypothetical protein